MTILGHHWSAEVVGAMIVALLSLALSAYGGYANNDKELAVKIRALEVQQANDKPRLERIEDKIDWLIRAHDRP